MRLLAPLAALLSCVACGDDADADDARGVLAPPDAAFEFTRRAPPPRPTLEGAAPREDPSAPSIDVARDALLDSLAHTLRDAPVDTDGAPLDPGGDADRCALWAALDDDARAVFLVLTDLLGHRTLLADGSNALAHVTALHAIRGRQREGCVRCCGDSEFNRLYVSIDDALAHALRTNALDAWRPSTDLAGPHAPFNLSLETVVGLPRGQLHLFADDADGVALGRAGVEGVVDARALEIDIDFNFIHESAPLCGYAGGDGVALYTEDFASEGDGAPVELEHAPSGC